MQEYSYVLMKLDPRIILQLFLNFSDFERQYSYKLYSYKRVYARLECTLGWSVHEAVAIIHTIVIDRSLIRIMFNGH